MKLIECVQLKLNRSLTTRLLSRADDFKSDARISSHWAFYTTKEEAEASDVALLDGCHFLLAQIRYNPKHIKIEMREIPEKGLRMS